MVTISKGRDTDSNDKYILTGRNPIREALKNNRDLEKLLVQKGELSGSAMEIVKTAKDRKILVQVVEKSRLDEISPHHQGLIAFASAFRYSSVEDILKSAEDKGEEPFLILIDEDNEFPDIYFSESVTIRQKIYAISKIESLFNNILIFFILIYSKGVQIIRDAYGIKLRKLLRK